MKRTYIVFSRVNPGVNDRVHVSRLANDPKTGRPALTGGWACEKGYRDVDQAACDIIAAFDRGMKKFPKNFVPQGTDVLRKGRDILHQEGGITLNYPAWLYRQSWSTTNNNHIQLIRIEV